MTSFAAAAVARRIFVFKGCIWKLPQILLFDDIRASSMECLSLPLTIGRVYFADVFIVRWRVLNDYKLILE
jgi:hypothetical protein